MLLVGFRAITNLYIFGPYRVQIQLFKQVFIDIVWFMSILMMLTVIFSIVYGVEFALKPDEETNAVSTDSIKNNFVTYLGLFYQFILGENPYEELSTTAWIVYLL